MPALHVIYCLPAAPFYTVSGPAAKQRALPTTEMNILDMKKTAVMYNTLIMPHRDLSRMLPSGGEASAYLRTCGYATLQGRSQSALDGEFPSMKSHIAIMRRSQGHDSATFSDFTIPILSLTPERTSALSSSGVTLDLVLISKFSFPPNFKRTIIPPLSSIRLPELNIMRCILLFALIGVVVSATIDAQVNFDKCDVCMANYDTLKSIYETGATAAEMRRLINDRCLLWGRFSSLCESMLNNVVHQMEIGQSISDPYTACRRFNYCW
ncbi:unnamed protein product [Calicophoron daubneyi]|uniref:Saposin B-type domain-containing protein n=1 Tax=Calicophoron daubneyi TaxID=300641 RepID=A0AAV2TGM0_CALDB